MNYRIDLHTHSTASPDGGISAEQYRELLGDGVLDCIAITDHNTVDLAVQLHQELGEKIIVGEEIETTAGEIVGLFLRETIPGGLSLAEAIQRIRAQGGIVYLPHPFETVRKGISKQDLEPLVDQIDIVEVYNGRAVAQNKGPEAAVWARLHHKPGAASSDAHGIKGTGTAFTMIDDMPTPATLPDLIHRGHRTMERPPIHSLFYPKWHRLQARFKKR